MREVTLPDTSHEAYRALTPEKLSKDYSDIISALRVLREATYEEIVTQLGWKDLSKCSRRMKELQSMQLIYKPGKKKLTSRNRFAYTYKLVLNGEKSAEPEKMIEGKSVSEISKDIQLVQKSLFP